ncbi:hypothetical protein K458DRAFT_488994 [Lentithecium fluviatile CBS 122367]|uniref:Uncharacterized protein n=1 Tax=Lentithecium fluviatile CBS 122367 TaxID=1168545 RepID=A0A6G1IUG4_9PLEO|nr:hypothetical protein K458DRAFT_488994 [Lentithecium fluviatile CBS 122367]
MHYYFLFIVILVGLLVFCCCSSSDESSQKMVRRIKGKWIEMHPFTNIDDIEIVTKQLPHRILPEGRYQLQLTWVAGIRITREPLTENCQEAYEEVLEMKDPNYTQELAVYNLEKHVDKMVAAYRLRLKQEALRSQYQWSVYNGE